MYVFHTSLTTFISVKFNEYCRTVADIDDTEVIWIAFNSTQIKHWFYLKIEQNRNNINNYTYK